MEYIVDIQGFKRPFNEFVFKEVAIIPVEDDSLPSVYLFESPHKWSFLPAKYKSENRWLEFNFHGISWDKGDISYDEVSDTLISLLRDASKIHIKGLTKKCWLDRILPNVYNIEDLGCPALSALPTNTNISCTNHASMRWTPHCSAHNVSMLKTWLLDLRKQTTSVESSSGISTNPTFDCIINDTTTLKGYYAECDFSL